MKPMLAGKLTDPAKLNFPVFVSPKLDGIRGLVVDGKLLGRSLKAIPNKHISDLLSTRQYNGFDGELVVGPTFQDTTSIVMAKDKISHFTYHVFDTFYDADAKFWKRYATLQAFAIGLPPFIKLVRCKTVNTVDDLLAAHAEYLDEGHEGTMIRSLDAPYKFGRSTEKEGYLLKLKPFNSIEVRVIGFEEKETNTNAKKTNALGRSARSSHKAGKVAAGTLGAFVCEHPDFANFNVGTGKGLTAELRSQIWNNQADYLGKYITIDFQDEGTKDKPRIPSFQGFRDPIDMSTD